MRRFAAGLLAGGAWSSLRCRQAALATTSTTGVDGAVDTAAGSEESHDYEFDLLVIGGGSGGLAAAKRAAGHGRKVALCDFVQPSTQGMTWGLGGTCVNVGCIPKKLMHQAALIGETLHGAAAPFGWELAGREGGDAEGAEAALAAPKLSWERLRANVDMHIRALNFGYVVQMRQTDIKYLNAYARFVDPHTVECTNKKGQVAKVSARRILLATGGRPTLPHIPGAKEFGVTSDDLFKLPNDPGKTLVVGASYVALECAGMLNGIGRSATVMMRSIPLRGFDQDMAEKVTQFMEESGVAFLRGFVPMRLHRPEGDTKIAVTMQNPASGEERVECFDTVLFATGRTPETRNIGLENAGVKLDKSGKVVVDPFDRTTTPHIYAIGDIAAGGLELTPVAIKAGQLLADRLYNKGSELMDYRTVPTTVFTPLEYGCCGFSEEDAKATYKDDISVFHTYLTPLEWTVPHFATNKCYVKLVVRKSDDVVVGFHVLSPNAGEITQGVAVAMRCGATKADFDKTIGIHPTIAESMTTLSVTKESGADATGKGC